MQNTFHTKLFTHIKGNSGIFSALPQHKGQVEVCRYAQGLSFSMPTVLPLQALPSGSVKRKIVPYNFSSNDWFTM